MKDFADKKPLYRRKGKPRSKEKKGNMNDLNYVLLAGNVVREPVSKIIDGTNTVCTFDIGVNRSFYNKREEKWVNYACFFHIETWGNVAISCAKNLSAGRGVRIVGRLHQSSWQTKDGRWGERVFIISEHVEFQPVKKTENVSVATPDAADMEKADLTETLKQLEESVANDYEAGPETFEEREEDCITEQ